MLFNKFIQIMIAPYIFYKESKKKKKLGKKINHSIGFLIHAFLRLKNPKMPFFCVCLEFTISFSRGSKGCVWNCSSLALWSKPSLASIGSICFWSNSWFFFTRLLTNFSWLSWLSWLSTFNSVGSSKFISKMASCFSFSLSFFDFSVSSIPTEVTFCYRHKSMKSRLSNNNKDQFLLYNIKCSLLLALLHKMISSSPSIVI